MSRLAKLLNPLHRFGGYFAPHVIVIAAIVAVFAFAGGVFTGTKVYDAAFFRTHFRASQPIPVTRARVTAPHVALASSGSINIDRYPAVGDQDGQGSCAAWATAWDLAFEYRMLHPTSWLRFSPRQMYSHYSDTYNGGADGGSWPDQDAEIAPTTGLLQFKALPEPPYVIDNPLPVYDAWGHLTSVDAAKHRFIPTFHALQGFAAGGGQGLVDSLRQTTANGQPTLIAFSVYPEYDNATAQPNIVGPSAGEVSRGGHSNVVLAYDDTRAMPDGTQGAFLIQNQWGTWWGISGRAWLSYSFVRQYVFGSEWASISPVTAAHAQTFVPSHAPTFKAPPVHKVSVPRGSGLPQVYGIKTWDTGVDISASINAAAARYHFSAPGYAALVGTESAFHQYAPHTPINGAGYCDYSGGLTQITVCTAAGLGVGNGSLSQSNIDYVFWYEQQDANRDVMFSARLVDQFHQAVCWDWSPLYASWNMGPGYGCFNPIYQYPTNPITQRAVANYRGWWDWVWASHVRYGPPPPPPTPKRPRFGHLRARVWSQYRRERHLSFIPHSGWYAWHWRRGDFRHAGGVVQHETYDARQHVMTEYLQGGWAWFWPGHPRWQTHWRGRSRWLR